MERYLDGVGSRRANPLRNARPQRTSYLGEGNAMPIRPFRESDLPQLIDLTIATFRPFYENYFRPLVGEEVFEHQHGHWEQDYRDDVPTLHDPGIGRRIAVAEIDGAVVGYVASRPTKGPAAGRST